MNRSEILKKFILLGAKVAAIIALIFVVLYFLIIFSGFLGNPYKYEPPKYVTGYLKRGAQWRDTDNEWHKNPYKASVEIYRETIKESNGKELIKIHFLSGWHDGDFGYTQEENLMRK